MRIYVTFGWGHAHTVGGQTLDKDRVAVIEAKDIEAGRARAFELFGKQFFTTYSQQPKMQYFPGGLVHLDGEG